MRSDSLRQTARGLTRNQTAAWSCERGTVAQSAGGANRRGLDAWRSGHADRSRQSSSKPSWCFQAGQHPDRLSHGNPAVSKFSMELSQVCDAPLIDAIRWESWFMEELTCILHPQRALLTFGDQTPTGQLGSRWKAAALNENHKKLERGNFIEVQHLIRSDTRLTFPSSFLPKHPHSQGKLSFGRVYVIDIRVGWWNLLLHGGNLLFKHKMRGNFIGEAVYEYCTRGRPEFSSKTAVSPSTSL